MPHRRSDWRDRRQPVGSAKALLQVSSLALVASGWCEWSPVCGLTQSLLAPLVPRPRAARSLSRRLLSLLIAPRGCKIDQRQPSLCARGLSEGLAALALGSRRACVLAVRLEDAIVGRKKEQNARRYWNKQIAKVDCAPS